MSPAPIILILAVSWWGAIGEVVLSVAKSRLGQFRQRDDHSFGSMLKRASEECSYMARTDDESHREELIQKIKNEMNIRKVEEFYRKTEDERRRSKEFYDRVEKEQRKRVLGRMPPHPPTRWKNGRAPPPPGNLPDEGNPPPRLPTRDGPPTSRRKHPPRRPSPSDEGPPRDLSRRSHHHRKYPSFSQGTFKDHNNCFGRCVFAGMELVDFLGFPDESHMRKALEDHVDDKKLRSSKIRRVRKCFDEVKKVAIDDNCIFSTKIFKCMGLDEPGAWS